MKKSVDILEEIRKVHENAQYYEKITSEPGPAYEKYESCKAQGIHYKDLPQTERDAVKKAQAEHDVKICAASNRAQFARIEEKILRDNARRAIVAEVLPAAVAVWNKYAGKKYGPKTKDKIRDEMQQATGQYISVNTSRYGNNYEMVIYHDSFRYDDLCVRSEWENGSAISPFVSEDNKVLPVEIEKLYLCYCGEYCADYARKAEEIVSAFRFMQNHYEEFEKSCNAFNSLLPSGMQRAYTRDYKDYLNNYIK